MKLFFSAWIRWLRFIFQISALVAAVMATVMAIWFLYVQPWFHIDPPYVQWFAENRCIVPRFCEQPVRFDQPLAAALLGAAILLFALGVALHDRRSIALDAAPSQSLDTHPLLLLALTCVGIFALAILFQIYQVSIKKEPANELIWLLAIALLVGVSYLFDRTFAPESSGKIVFMLIVGLGFSELVLAVAAIQAGHLLPLQLVLLLAGGLAIFFWGVSQCKRLGMAVPATDFVLVLLLALLMLELGLLRVWSWQFAFVGDEWTFYEMGVYSIHDLTAWRWFEIRGYNGYFAALSSQLIGWSMQLFGESIYGWRLASLLPLVLSVPAVYVIGDWLAGRSAGLLAAGFFAGQHALLQFALIPYNNTQAVPVVIISLALLILALRCQSALFYTLSGLTTGLGFIVYATGRLVLVPIAILLVFHGWGSWRRFWLSTLFVSFGVLATATPMLFNLNNWQSLLKSTPLQSEVISEQLSIYDQIIHNVTAGLLAFAFNPTNSHYIIGPFTDPVTALLLLLGIGLMVTTAWRTRRYLSWLLASLLFIILISGVQQYGRLGTTRMFMLPFFYVLFAAVGATFLFNFFAKQPKRQQTFLPGMLIIGVVLLNQFHIERVALPNIPSSPHSLLIQQAQLSAAENENKIPLYVIWQDIDPQLINRMLRAYRLNSGQVAFISPQELVEFDSLCRAAAQPQIVLIHRNASDYNQSIAQLEKCWPTGSRSEIVNHAGIPVFTRFVTQPAQAKLTTYDPLAYRIPSLTRSQTIRKAERIVIDANNILYAISRPLALLYRLDLASGKLSQSPLIQKAARDIAITADGLLLVAGEDKKLVWYDANGAIVRILPPSDQIGRLHSLAIADNGDIYASDIDNWRIVHLSPIGDFLAVLTGGEQLGHPTAIALAGDNSSLWSLDAEAGRIFHLSLKDDTILAEIAGPQSNIDRTGRLAVTVQDQLIMVDSQRGRVARLSADGRMEAAHSGLLQPMGFATTPTGRMLLADWITDEIVELPAEHDQLAPPPVRVRIDATSQSLDLSLAKPDSPLSESPLSQPGNAADGEKINADQYTYLGRDQIVGLGQAHTLAIGSNGQIYLIDSAGRQFYILDRAGKIIAQIKNSDSPFQELSDIAIDSAGTVYVLDARRSLISLFSPSGSYLRSLVQTQGKLGFSRGIHVDDTGQIWVAATSLGKILGLDANGAQLSVIPIGENSTGQPVDVITTQAGTLLVAEGSRGEILHLTSDGEILNRRVVPRFNTSEGAHFAADSLGNLYITSPELGELTLLNVQGDALRQWRFMIDANRMAKIIGAAVSPEGEIWATDVVKGGLIHYTPP